MSSSIETRDFIVLCYSQGLIDDAEFMILSSVLVQTSSGAVQTSQLRPVVYVPRIHSLIWRTWMMTNVWPKFVQEERYTC